MGFTHLTMHRCSKPVVLLLVCLCVLPNAATVADDAAGEAATPSPPAALARYHVTVTVREKKETGGARVAESVVRDLGTGSGTILGEWRLVVTAAHVVEPAGSEIVITAHDGSTYEAKVLRVTPDAELAILQASRPWDFDIEPAPLADDPEPDDAVSGIGINRDRVVTAEHGTVRTPRLDFQFRFGEFGFRDPIVLAMPITPGFSGGPVFDDQGRWLGMIVGFGLARTPDGQVMNTGETYVLPAGRILGLGVGDG